MQNEMKKDEQGYFQNLQKQITLQTIDFISNSPSFHRYKAPIKKQESIPWKFEQIPNNYENKSPKKIITTTKNISFQDSQQYISDNDDSSNEQTQESEFQSYYLNKTNIYKKKYNFGTNLIGKKQYFASTFINPNRIQKHSLQYYVKNNDIDNISQNKDKDKDIKFDSEFQSGNLLSAFKIGQYQYDLILQNDINTKGNTQWFYFRIVNLTKNNPIKINIVNLRKSDSLFNYGMLPCIFSMQEDNKTKRGWYRGGKNVKYFRNDHQIENSKRYYSTLTFTISTQYDHDILKVAQCYPYTYSDLNIYLDNIQKIKYKKELIQRQTIMTTIGRNKIDAINIKQNNNKIKNRPIIFIMARQHPGQTPASYVCEGMIDYFLSKQKQSQFLRKNYEIIVVPMINPDGVCAGNYRTNLYGFDLNRRWDGSKFKNYHQSSEIKKYLYQISKGRQIALILDIHGHSRKLFSFFYGNKSSGFPIQIRLLPYICSKIGQNLIRFEDSTFLNEQQKRNTARVQLSNQFKLLNVYTFQASFFGYFGKDRQKKHFTTQGYRQLGNFLGKGIHINCKGKLLNQINPDNRQIIFYKKCIIQLKLNVHLLIVGQKQNSGSQSSPQECQVKQSEEQKLQINDLYNKDPQSPKTFKINRKIIKKQMIKIPIRSQRRMQIIDLAQVNSIFPNNILALIPNSFINKNNKKKVITSNIAIQTDISPIIKIYQTCKKQEGFFLQPQKSVIFQKQQFNTMEHSSPSNLLKSSLLSRPKSQSLGRKQCQSISASIYNNSNKIINNTSKSKTNRFINTITSNYKISRSEYKVKVNNNGKTQDKESQTIMSFSCRILNDKNKYLMQQEMKILQYKTIDIQKNSYNNKLLSRQKFQKIEKETQIAILQHIKLRKKNIS